MSVEPRGRRVLSDMAPAVGAGGLLAEARGAGAAPWPYDGPPQALAGDARSWVDLMADAGFLVALVHDATGTHLEVS